MIQCPTCPVCQGPPAFILANGHQCFCGDDACPVLTWDSHETREANLSNANWLRMEDLRMEGEK